MLKNILYVIIAASFTTVCCFLADKVFNKNKPEAGQVWIFTNYEENPYVKQDTTFVYVVSTLKNLNKDTWIKFLSEEDASINYMSSYHFCLEYEFLRKATKEDSLYLYLMFK